MDVKVTVNLPEETVAALRQIAEHHGITMTEALAKAITTEKFLLDKIDKGSKVLIESRDRKNTQRVLL
jgi:hypothetical protein